MLHGIFVDDELVLIHLAYPQSRPVFLFSHTSSVCTYVHFSKSRKTKQISSENCDRYCHDCGFGRGDHWWHLSYCTVRVFLLQEDDINFQFFFCYFLYCVNKFTNSYHSEYLQEEEEIIFNLHLNYYLYYPGLMLIFHQKFFCHPISTFSGKPDHILSRLSRCDMKNIKKRTSDIGWRDAREYR